MTLYDELIDGAIDLHCHLDLEFSREQTKREPEPLWLPKAEAMGLRGVVTARGGMGVRLRRARRV